MTSHIKNNFDKMNINISSSRIRELDGLIRKYENKNLMALNDNLLGVHYLKFLPSDKEALFDIFNVDSSYIKKIITNHIPSINNEFKVLSDETNVLCIYLIYRSQSEIKNKRERDKFNINVLKYLQYKFFSSLIYKYFPYNSKEPVMKYTIENISKRFDIYIYKTWRNVIENRAKDILLEDSIHYEVLEKCEPDESFLYVLSDISTRLNSKVKLIVSKYYENLANEARLGISKTVLEGDEGTYIREDVGMLEPAISQVIREIANINLFIEPSLINKFNRQFKNFNPVMFKKMATNLSVMNNEQVKRRIGNQAIKRNRDKSYEVSIKILIKDIIETIYRQSVRQKVDAKNLKKLFIMAKNSFGSSKIINEEILDIRHRLTILVDEMNLTTVEHTKSSLKISFILYILIKAFRKF